MSRNHFSIILAFLASLLLGRVAQAAPEDVDVYRIDFGPANTVAPGYMAITLESADPRFFWRGKGLGMRDRGGPDALNRDLVYGAYGEFAVGLDNGRYKVTLAFGDNDYPHGPFSLFAQDTLVEDNIRTQRAQFLSKTFMATVQDEKLRLKFAPKGNAPDFAVTSLVIHGPLQIGRHSAYPEPEPPRAIPSLQDLEAEIQLAPRDALKEYAGWLLRYQTERGCFDYNSSEWYRTSYPLRTLLAAYNILGDRRYLDAVTTCLDRFVAEQLPNGAWSHRFLSKPTSQRTEDEIKRLMENTTNTADLGPMSTCLAVAYPYVDEHRRQRYLGALKSNADNYSIRWQLANGAFTNGRQGGQDMTTPYSVATGTQGMNFCALYAVTGDARYLRVAERAVEFLLDNWREDGRPVHHHHSTDAESIEDVTSFGNIYYYHEAILWVYTWTGEQRLRDRIKRVYGWHIKGPKGLLQAREKAIWWPLGNSWQNSKAGSMPLVLIEYDRSMVHDPVVHEAVMRCTAFLCRREYARRIGIMTDPDLPWGEFSVVATGFAGLTLAELIKPGVVYMKSRPASP